MFSRSDVRKYFFQAELAVEKLTEERRAIKREKEKLERNLVTNS